MTTIRFALKEDKWYGGCYNLSDEFRNAISKLYHKGWVTTEYDEKASSFWIKTTYDINDTALIIDRFNEYPIIFIGDESKISQTVSKLEKELSRFSLAPKTKYAA